MRPSEKFEAKAAGQKGSPGVVFSTLRTFFHRQRRHRALQPAAIERVIWIGSKPSNHPSGNLYIVLSIENFRLCAGK